MLSVLTNKTDTFYCPTPYFAYFILRHTENVELLPINLKLMSDDERRENLTPASSTGPHGKVAMERPSHGSLGTYGAGFSDPEQKKTN